MKIQAINVEKSFNNNKVLHDANITLHPGEIHAFMGENGAGKSTLMNIITGDLIFDKGKILIDDIEVTPYKNKNKQISFIRQELNLISGLTIYENMFLGKLGKYIVDDKILIKKTSEIFKKLELKLDPKLKVNSLSIGQQQMVEIAKGLNEDCKVLIMDEPTAALTDKEIIQLFKIIKGLKNDGVTIVYISHRMSEIFEISDRITVMRDGVFIDEFLTEKVTEEKLINSMVGRELKLDENNKTSSFGSEVLRVMNLSNNKEGFENINFNVREGEILAIAGLMGSKRTEIVETIFNINKADKGEIIYFNENIENTSIKNVIEKGISLVTEDRKQTGLFLEFDIKTNIGIPNPVHVSKNGIISKEKEEKLAEYFAEKLNIKYDNLNQKVSGLSGGNQQKVVISKWLATMPKLLILDEPTRGIDINAKREIYKLMKEQANNKMAIILISSEMSETLLLADTIVTLNEGKQTNTLTNENLSEEKLLEFMIGGNDGK